MLALGGCGLLWGRYLPGLVCLPHRWFRLISSKRKVFGIQRCRETAPWPGSKLTSQMRADGQHVFRTHHLDSISRENAEPESNDNETPDKPKWGISISKGGRDCILQTCQYLKRRLGKCSRLKSAKKSWQLTVIAGPRLDVWGRGDAVKNVPMDKIGILIVKYRLNVLMLILVLWLCTRISLFLEIHSEYCVGVKRHYVCNLSSNDSQKNCW